MARIDDMERQLLNWARWRAQMEDGGGNFARTSMEPRVDGQGYDAPTVIGTNDAEAEITQAGVMALDSALRAVVEAHYLGGGPVHRKARRLMVSEATYYARIELAHRALQMWLGDRQRTQAQQRQRMEALQRAARP